MVIGYSINFITVRFYNILGTIIVIIITITVIIVIVTAQSN